MYAETITFQLATHYLSKIALRIDCLYQTISQACVETHPIIHHYALKNLLEIFTIIEKPELKSRFLKELMRIEHSLKKLPNLISESSVLDLHKEIQSLVHLSGPFGGGLLQDNLLQIFRTTQDFETYPPPLLFWLESDSLRRQENLSMWLANLDSLYSSVSVYLNLLKSTAEFSTIIIDNGFYQQNLNASAACQLILVEIEKSLGLIPRMQLGRHGLSLRFFEARTLNDVNNQNIKFELALCGL